MNEKRVYTEIPKEERPSYLRRMKGDGDIEPKGPLESSGLQKIIHQSVHSVVRTPWIDTFVRIGKAYEGGDLEYSVPTAHLSIPTHVGGDVYLLDVAEMTSKFIRSLENHRYIDRDICRLMRGESELDYPDGKLRLGTQGGGEFILVNRESNKSLLTISEVLLDGPYSVHRSITFGLIGEEGFVKHIPIEPPSGGNIWKVELEISSRKGQRTLDILFGRLVQYYEHSDLERLDVEDLESAV